MPRSCTCTPRSGSVALSLDETTVPWGTADGNVNLKTDFRTLLRTFSAPPRELDAGDRERSDHATDAHRVVGVTGDAVPLEDAFDVAVVDGAHRVRRNGVGLRGEGGLRCGVAGQQGSDRRDEGSQA